MQDKGLTVEDLRTFFKKYGKSSGDEATDNFGIGSKVDLTLRRPYGVVIVYEENGEVKQLRHDT